MALARHYVTAQDAEGNALATPTIEVRKELPGQPLATIYSDDAGASVRTNPFTAADLDDCYFHAAGGRYQIKVTSGSDERIWRYQSIGLGAGTDFTALYPKGAWDSEGVYNIGDVVSEEVSGGDVYLFASIIDDNEGNEPDSATPGNTLAWMFLGIAVGVQGEDGLPGSSDVTGTSTSSVAIGTGTKSFTIVETSRGWAVGARLRISSDANPTVNWMEGVVTSYSGTALEISVDLVHGSGTLDDWTINLAGEPGAGGDSTESTLQAASAKSSVVGNDRLPLLDSESSNALKYVIASVLAGFILTPTPLVDSDDLDALTTPGLFSLAGVTVSNVPGSRTYGNVLVTTDGSQPTQLFWGGVNAAGGIAFRRKDAGTWYDWKEIPISGALAVSDFNPLAIVLEAAGIAGNHDDTSLPTSLAVKAYVDRNFTADRTAIKALTPVAGDTSFLMEYPRGGLFRFDDSDLSAEVAADTEEGIYISSGDGSAGAWVRQRQEGYLESNWFGHSTAETAANNDTALQACLDYAMAEDGPPIVQMPSGTFSHNTDALTIGAVANKRIIVRGRGASTILSFTASSASNGFWIGHATAAQTGFACRLEDFRINGDSQTYITGIYMKYASGQVVTNVWFQTLLECVAIETCFSVQLRLNNARNIGADFFRAVDRTHNFCAEGNKLFTLGNYAYNFQGTLGHLGIYIAGAGNEDIEGAVGFVKSAGPLYSFVFRDVYSEQTTGDIFDFGDVVWGEITNNIFQFGNSHTTDIENFVGRWDNNRLYDVQITWGSGSFPKVGNANTVASGGSFPAMPFRERELIYHSADAVSHTGDTSETTLVTVTIPAGVLGTKGFVEWDATWQAGASNANAKTLRARLDGISGTAFYAGSLAGSRIIRAHGGFANTAADAQKGRFVSAGGGSGGQFGTAAAVPVTAAVDTSAAVDLVFTVELANSGDTAGLEMLTVWLTRG
ncbi:MAG: hypothetical protein H6883_07280 [Rhodobiaceae bacterium]|nr:hypothetical protein [Rhodobiaceae bacterium]MCC0055922.1 hypothetical protein [Rhodobiaceae bacterium]